MTERLGPDGLLEPPDELIAPAPLVYTVASAGLFISCAVGAWALQKLTRTILSTPLRQDRAGDYWQY